MKRYFPTLFLFIALSTPAGALAQSARPAGPDIDLDALAHRVHELVNAEREREKIAPLKTHNRLTELAGNHSADMAVRNFVDHYNPEGASPSERAEAAGFNCTVQPFDGRFPLGIGENIFMSYLYTTYEIVVTNGVEARTYNWKDFETLAREIVDNWMNSEGHRENILRKDYHLTGIGIATDTTYRLFVTQNFC